MKCKENVKFTTVGNYTKYCIDLLPLRHHTKKEKILIAGLHTTTRAKHIHGADYYDKSRQLSAINKIQLAPKKQRADYIKIDNKKVLLSKYIRQLKSARIPFILDNKLNKKLYVNGNVYDIINTIA